MKTPLLILALATAVSAQAQRLLPLQPSSLAHWQRVLHPGPAGIAAGRTAALPARRPAATMRVPGTAVSYQWSSFTNQWEDATTIAYTYNGFGQVTQQVLADSATTTPRSRTLTTYNAVAAPTQEHAQFWDGTGWADDARNIWVYDSRQNLQEERREYFDGIAWSIVAGTRYLNTYSTANHLTAQAVQKYDTATSTFVNKVRHEYVVGPNGTWNQETIQRWHNNAWEDSVRATNIVWHDFDKRQVASAFLQSPSGSQWVTTARLVGSFSPASEVTLVEQLTNAGSYQNYARFSTSYDTQGTMTASGVEGWNDAASAWEVVLQERHLPTYDAAGDLRRRIDQMQIPFFTNGLENTTRFHFANYQAVVLGNRSAAVSATLSAFPNPSPDGTFTLQAAAAQSPAVLRVVDALGRQVHEQQYPAGLPTRLALDLRGQAPGLYVVEVLSAGRPARLRVQIQ